MALSRPDPQHPTVSERAAHPTPGAGEATLSTWGVLLLAAGWIALGLQTSIWLYHRFLVPLLKVLEAPGWAPYLGGEPGISPLHLALACWRNTPCWQQYQQQIPAWQSQDWLITWPLAIVFLGLLRPTPPVARKLPGSAHWSQTRDVQHLLYSQLPPRKG